MAEPQKQPRAEASTVSACHATDCIHNEDEECRAGAIVVGMSADGHATCQTYETESPRARP